MSFNFNIGEVPEGWEHAEDVRVINGEFKFGARASIESVLTDYAAPVNPNLCMYMFYKRDVERVRAWVDWFMTEYER